jgi:hypothetical protein
MVMKWLGFPRGHEFRTKPVDELVQRYTGASPDEIEAYKARLGWKGPSQPPISGRASRSAKKQTAIRRTK